VQLKIRFSRTLPKHKANVFNFLYYIKFIRIIIYDKSSLLSFIGRNLFWPSLVVLQYMLKLAVEQGCGGGGGGGGGGGSCHTYEM
jgi:hypothetical protein